MSGFWYLHSSFSGTSYRCGLNENMFGFRRDPTCGMDRKNLSIIFSKVRQLPLPSGGGLGIVGGVWRDGAGTGLVF